MEYTNSIFRVDTRHDQINNSVLECINGRAVDLAYAFGIHALPSDLKLCIHLCEYEQFIELADKFGISKQYNECLAFCYDAIYAIEYTYIDATQIEDDYCKIILHECIHLLQHISTGLMPIKAIWLYESIACYLADQKMNIPACLPSWQSFHSDFYSIKDNYAIAYLFGKELIDNIGLERIIEIQDNLKELHAIGYRVYKELQNKSILNHHQTL